jgi:6-pyruvoyltetrahydropterin/6-carboxytetrahydropterin synthase
MSEITITANPARAASRATNYAEIFREFSFEAAHHLPYVSEGHKCARLHGHSYRIEVRVRGEVGPETGWVADFADITQAFEPLHARLDHYYLNEIEGLENPTSENLARWIWERLVADLPGLYEVVVRETCTSGCSYCGEVAK